MTAKRILVLCAAVVVCCFVIGMLADEVHAQGDSDSAKAIDKDRATKQGVRNSLANGKKEDEDAGPGPTKLQMVLGLGSCGVAFVVWKWL